MTPGPRLSVSTWSLHRTLGRPANYGPGGAPAGANGGLPLLELPARLVAFGIHTLEICHFHLPALEAGYLERLRAALEEAGIELWSLLVDGGDITHPEHGEADLAWIGSWLPVAARLGAANMRVVAGEAAPGPASLARSAAGLRRLVDAAAGTGVRVMTENWKPLLGDAGTVLALLAELDGQVGLCADFGNWRGPVKYDELARILPLAASCHTKCHFKGPDEPDREDYLRCLELARQAGFAGPHTLIYDGPNDDEWFGLGLEREMVAPYLPN